MTISEHIKTHEVAKGWDELASKIRTAKANPAEALTQRVETYDRQINPERKPHTDCYFIGIDAAKNGDCNAITVLCKDCHTILLSDVFASESALIIPKQCPRCNADTSAED